MRSALLLLSAIFLFSGCATYTREQIYAVQASGVSPYVVSKLAHDRVLLPDDIIQLRRHRVSDYIPIRSLHEVGVDYIPQREDLRHMRSADVHPVVIDEVIVAGQKFANRENDHSSFAWGLSIPLFAWVPYGYGWGGYGGWGYGNYYGGHGNHYYNNHGYNHGGHNYHHHN